MSRRTMTRWDAAAHHAAELDLLSAVSTATHKASTETAPVRQRTEGAAEFDQRWRAYVKRCGIATFRTVFGHARVVKSRARLERFAREVRSCGGYRPGKPHAVARDRENWQGLQPASASDARRYNWVTSEGLSVMLEERKTHALAVMRQRWNGADCGPSVRLNLAWDIEVVQREMVRRGLLDATDHDKVNAAPVQETLPEATPKPVTAPAPRRLRAVTAKLARSRPHPAMRPDAVEFVEAIETADGKLVIAVFDDDVELLGLYEGFQSRIRLPQDLRVALAAPAVGAIHDWPPSCDDPQATYDRLTEHRWDYNVIGRWSRDEGLDLIELKLSRLLGRGPRAILRAPLAA